MLKISGAKHPDEVPPTTGSDDRRGLGREHCDFGMVAVSRRGAATEQSGAAKLDRAEEEYEEVRVSV